MVEHYCECCDYSTKDKYKMDRHCNTQKHHKNVKKMEDRLNGILPTRGPKPVGDCICRFCYKKFKTKGSTKRHEENTCKENPHSKNVKKNSDKRLDNVQSQIDQLMKKLKISQSELNKKSRRNSFSKIGAYDKNTVIDPEPNTVLGDDFQKNMSMLSNMNNQIFHNANNEKRQVVNKTRITINGEDIGENPMEDFSTRRALMVAFGNPFFKHNRHFVPLEYFQHDKFREFFNIVHKLDIKKPTDQEVHDSIFNPIQNGNFMNGIQNVIKGPYSNAVVSSSTTNTTSQLPMFGMKNDMNSMLLDESDDEDLF